MRLSGPGALAPRLVTRTAVCAALATLAFAPPALADSVALNSGATPVALSVPGRAGTSAAVVVAKKPFWGQPVGVSKWIGPDTNAGVNTGPNTTSTYRATFTLPAGFVAPALQVS